MALVIENSQVLQKSLSLALELCVCGMYMVIHHCIMYIWVRPFPKELGTIGPYLLFIDFLFPRLTLHGTKMKSFAS